MKLHPVIQIRIKAIEYKLKLTLIRTVRHLLVITLMIYVNLLKVILQIQPYAFKIFCWEMPMTHITSLILESVY